MTSGLELPPLGAPFNFAQPFDGSTIRILTPEQDYFYWPCMSGEKYPPTLAAGGGTAAYSSFDTYPTIALSTAAGAAPTATWPVLPSWKYSATAFAGYTISFRVNLSTAGTNANNGSEFQFDPAGAQYIRWQNTAQVATQFGGTIRTLALAATTGLWYSVVVTVDASNRATLVINGTTYLTNVASNLGITALQPRFMAARYSLAGTTTGYLTQLQVTYT